MIPGFEKREVKTLSDNVFTLLDTDWMLITAGKPESFNTMTASWGGFGILWGKPTATCVIRPQRHTASFMNTNDYFTLTFFAEEHRNILNLCGKTSGRNTNKIKETGLTPLFTAHETIAYEQSRMIMVCRKLYVDDFNPEKFTDTSIPGKIYPTNDFHRFYIAEIVECYCRV